MPNKEFQVGDTVYEFPDTYDDAKVQSILTKQGVIKQPPKKSSGAGLVTGVLGSLYDAAQYGKGILKEAGKEAENFEDFSTFGVKPLLEKAIPPLGKARKEREKLTELRTPGEKTGSKILQGAELVAPIPGVSELKAVAGAGRLARAGLTAARGALDVGLKTAVQTGNAKEAAEAAVVGGGVGAAVEAAAKPLSKWFANAARKQYLKVLHPLGSKAKEASEVVAKQGGGDDLIRRGITGWSKEGLADKFASEAEKTGKALEAEYAKLDKTKKQAIAPIFDSFQRWLEKETTTPGGHEKAGADALISEANKQVKLLLQLGDEASPSELWHIRRSIDKYVFRNLTADESAAAGNEIRQGLSNTIREHMNSDNPTVEGLNKEYRLWKTASELMMRNIRNERGKLDFAKNTGAIGRFLMGAAVGGGESYREGHSPLEVGGAAVLMGMAMSSPKWRTVAAVQKDKIAQLLAAGQGQAAANLAARAAGVSVRAAQ